MLIFVKCNTIIFEVTLEISDIEREGDGEGEAKGTVLSFLRETERYNTTNSFDGTFYASTLHVCKSNIKSGAINWID